MSEITVFSIPKPFVGHTGIIQSNAIQSWKRLMGCQVVLFGEEEGLALAAADLGVRHEPKISRNVHGTPLISEAFKQARSMASSPVLAYVNSDVILLSDFVRAAAEVARAGLDRFLLVGRRYDLDVNSAVSFEEGWETCLRNDVATRGVPHGLSGIDYFLFPASLNLELPPFAVGRPGWDSWLMYSMRASGVPLIDASDFVTAVHQNHPPAYQTHGAEAQSNASLAGGYFRMGTIRDATWRLSHSGGVHRQSLIRRLLGEIWFSAPMRHLLAFKRCLCVKIKQRAER